MGSLSCDPSTRRTFALRTSGILLLEVVFLFVRVATNTLFFLKLLQAMPELGAGAGMSTPEEWDYDTSGRSAPEDP